MDPREIFYNEISFELNQDQSFIIKAKFIFGVTRTPDYIEISRCTREEFLRTKKDVEIMKKNIHELDIFPEEIS